MRKTRSYSLMICFLVCLTLTGLLLTTKAYAASMDSWAYGGKDSDYTYGLVVTPDGGHMMVGSTCSYGAGGSDIWLVKIDAHGSMLWNRTFGGPYTDYGCNVVAASDGSYVIIGYTCYSDAVGDLECPDAWLIKVDANGNMLWNKTYGTATDSDYLTTIAVAPDGGYIMAGAKYLDVSGTGQAWALKVDSQGIVQWSKTFPDTHANVFWGVTVTSDGSYAFAGQKYGGSSDDLWAVKLDSNGNLLWSKTFGGSESEVGWWILQNKDGSFTLSGTTASYGAGKNDFWLVNINQNGALQWSQTYGGPEDEIGYVLAATPDGGYAMVGSTLSYGTAGSSDFWLIKTDKNGKLLWNQTMGGPDYDQGQCLTVSQDGVYSIAGTTASYGAGATDGWLIVSDAFEPTTAAPSSTPMQASMQAIFVLIFAVIMAVISLMIVSKRREQPH